MLIWSAVVASVVTLASLVHCEQVEVKGGKQIEFYEDLSEGASWGVQFQIVDGTIGFRVLFTFS